VFLALVLNSTSVELQGDLFVSSSNALNVTASSLSVNGSLSLAPAATLTLSSSSSLVVTGISSHLSLLHCSSQLFVDIGNVVVSNNSVLTVESKSSVVNVSGCITFYGTLVVHVATPIDQSVVVNAPFLLLLSSLCTSHIDDHYAD